MFNFALDFFSQTAPKYDTPCVYIFARHMDLHAKSERKNLHPQDNRIETRTGHGGAKRKERAFDSERQSEGEICITLALICATLCSHDIPANPLATWRGWMGICRTFPYAHACKANSTLISCGTLYRLWGLMGLN